MHASTCSRALVDWVEKGVPAEDVIATKYTPENKVQMTRPLCPYPAVAKYKGSPDSLVPVFAQRIGIEKQGDSFALFVSLEGEPMHPFGPPIRLHIDGPFYAGIGFCSHLPDESDTAVLSNVVLENSAGKVH